MSSCGPLPQAERIEAVYTATPMPREATSTPGAVKTIQSSLVSTVVPTAIAEKTSFPDAWIFPDGELVYSLTSVNFSVDSYLQNTTGYLVTYQQLLMSTGWNGAAEIIEMVAVDNSINPKLLLALIEYQSGTVFSNSEYIDPEYPALGNTDYYRQDLYGQLDWAVNRLSEGFYGWLNGTIQEIQFQNGEVYLPPAEVNPGTFALQYFFAGIHEGVEWEKDLDPATGFPVLYKAMFGDPWENPTAAKPLLPEDLAQPNFTLPFEMGVTWALTGGPHPAFEGNGPLAALDFVPPMTKTGCYPTGEWVTAVADGLIVRSDLGQVIQDLDGDGLEQTGWAILYLHVSNEDRVPVGTYLEQGDYLGHPSCEGGRAFGTHLHLARKYNGVWIAADGDIPFVMDGWRAVAGEDPYLGGLVRDGQVVVADQYGALCSLLLRDCEPTLSILSKISR